jgi:tRNA wybutosine-synthesizing protein 1
MDTLELTDQDPLELLYESVRAQRRLLSGFGGNPKVPREKWLDAQNPKHVAISLNGEPTLYTRLSEYMELCHKHGMTTMLVTNGTLPKVIEKLDTLPTQLYVSVDAPNKEVFDAVCKPKWNGNAWDKFEETIDLLPSLDTRIVARHTLMKGVNMSDKHIEQFAALDNRADPDYIENKGYVFVGHSRENLSIENMPSHEDIMNFSNKIAPLTNREVLSDSRASRVALVGREISPIPIPEATMFFPEDLGIAPSVKHLPMAG